MNRTLTHSLHLLLLTALIAALASCSSKKSAQQDNNSSSSSSSTSTKHEVKSVAESYMFSLANTYDDWKALAMSASFELADPKQIKLSGKVYMERGKSIYISLRIIGMEVATVYITNDMIYATDKIHRYYVAEEVKSLLAGYDFTVEDLQDLLLGRAFIAGKGVITKNDASKVKILSDNGGPNWSFTPPAQKGLTYKFNIEPDPQHVRSIEFIPEGYRPVTCYYSEPTRTTAGVMAKAVTIKANPGNVKVQANFTWDLKGAKWKSSDLREWRQPEGYTRLNKDDIIKMFTSFD